jgi:hypothetical protein
MICDKTVAAPEDDLYKPLFTMLDKAGNRTVNANETTRFFYRCFHL